MTQNPTKRIEALDVLRGITITLMIIANNPGSYAHFFAPLRHAPWNGLTPTDCIFPCFLFVMGFSTYLSLLKRDFVLDRKLVTRILSRTVLLFGIGILMNFCYSRSFANVRILGVLQRFALCYVAVAFLACTNVRKAFPLIAAVIIALYTVLLLAANGFEYGTGNILSRIDIGVLGLNHIYNDNGIEPEGLLSTLPAIAHTMIGFCVAGMCHKYHDTVGKIFKLLVIGSSMILVGALLSYACPLNKKVWSPTFVLVTCGISSCLLGLLMYAIDYKAWFKKNTFFKVFGTNAILCYILAFVIAYGVSHICIGEYNLLYYAQQALFSVFGENCMASLIYPLLICGVIFGITYPLYKKGIYIRL